jgi:hypothetical protein
VVEIHKNDVLGIILDGHSALIVVHYIVNSVWIQGFDLGSSKVYLYAPQHKALLILLWLLKKDINNIFD